MSTVSVRYIVDGWNRFQLEVSDLVTTVERLRMSGVSFRNEVVIGVGGKQILIDDPSGNPVELFEPTLPDLRARRPSPFDRCIVHPMGTPAP